jgi:tRNA modification GTPase
VTDKDTIAAVASAPGRGAIGVIRVSGPDTPRVAREILGTLPAARLATLSAFRDAAGSAIDSGLALYFPAPHSFTGEDVLELQGHGGAVVLDLLLSRLLALGCRAARPGEFSERAFLNGKLDLAQAEAIADLIDAGSEAAARAAVRSLKGEFSAAINELQDRITGLRVLIEAAIDFPDEEIDFASNEALRMRLAELNAAFREIEAKAHQGALLREGLKVVIAGRPNAGKSSLMNRLAGESVAIVTDTPGTTRDVLKEVVQLEGLTLELIDTAGLRATQEHIEAEGVRRARAQIETADLVLYVIDANAPAGEELPARSGHTKLVRVYNKVDLLSPAGRDALKALGDGLMVCAVSGEGIAELRNQIKRAAGFAPSAGVFSARRRHLQALQRSHAAVNEAERSLLETRAFELLAEELRLAQLSLSEITGAFGSEELLGEIFGSFCIGK